MFGHKVPPIEPDLGKHNPSLSLPGAQAHLFDEGVWQAQGATQAMNAELTRLQTELVKAQQEAKAWRDKYEETAAELQAYKNGNVRPVVPYGNLTPAEIEKMKTDLDLLKFRNEVLQCMLTISESDYLQVIAEKGYHNDDLKYSMFKRHLHP